MYICLGSCIRKDGLMLLRVSSSVLKGAPAFFLGVPPDLRSVSPLHPHEPGYLRVAGGELVLGLHGEPGRYRSRARAKSKVSISRLHAVYRVIVKKRDLQKSGSGECILRYCIAFSPPAVNWYFPSRSSTNPAPASSLKPLLTRNS